MAGYGKYYPGDPAYDDMRRAFYEMYHDEKVREHSGGNRSAAKDGLCTYKNIRA